MHIKNNYLPSVFSPAAFLQLGDFANHPASPPAAVAAAPQLGTTAGPLSPLEGCSEAATAGLKAVASCLIPAPELAVLRLIPPPTWAEQRQD